MRVLLLFIDGIGIGDDDPQVNPFSVAHLPTLTRLTNGQRWVKGIGRVQTPLATFIPTDPRMGVSGLPQSASGQASIITGRNIPALIGEHYGPRPNPAIQALIREGTLFDAVRQANKSSALIAAYPQRLHDEIERGKRLPASYQQAILQQGIPLFGVDDLLAGRAMSEDWTNQAWRDFLGYPDMSVISAHEAGKKLVQVARQYDFAFMSHWMTDYVGHRGSLADAVQLLETLDGVFSGVLEEWHPDEGIILLTSDHGNMEAIGDRRHTANDVPTLILGTHKDIMSPSIHTLADIAPMLKELLLN
ncbi:MAG: hypothetical protein ACOYLB_02835 [Phototrophicaceae bacterium]